MRNYWGFDEYYAFWLTFSATIPVVNHLDIIKKINYILIEGMIKYKYLKIVDLPIAYSEWNIRDTYPLQENMYFDSIGIHEWLIFQVNQAHKNYDDLELFEMFVVLDGKLCEVSFTINGWKEFVETLPIRTSTEPNFSSLFNAVMNLPLSIFSMPIMADKIDSEGQIEIYFSLYSPYTIWYPEVLLYNARVEKKSNFKIALLNSSRFNSLLRNISTKLQEFEFQVKVDASTGESKYLSKDGILVNDKLNYWEEIETQYLDIPKLTWS